MRFFSFTPQLVSCFLMLALVSSCASVALTGATETAKVAAERRSFGQAVDDAAIYTEILHLFIQADVNDLLVNVGVTVRGGRVLLTGKVDKPETTALAVKEAWKAHQVKEVINEIEVVPGGGFFSRAGDEIVEKELESRLLFTKGTDFMNYSIEVVNKTAFLLGTVETEAELNRILQVARTTKGVRKVIGHIRVTPAIPAPMPTGVR